MNKETRVVNITRTNKGEFKIESNMDAMPMEVVEDVLNETSKKIEKEIMSKCTEDKVDAALQIAVNELLRPWRITAIVEFIIIILLVLEKVL